MAVFQLGPNSIYAIWLRELLKIYILMCVGEIYKCHIFFREKYVVGINPGAWFSIVASLVQCRISDLPRFELGKVKIDKLSRFCRLYST